MFIAHLERSLCTGVRHECRSPEAPGRAVVSYYSRHERDASSKQITALYLAELVIEA